MKATIRAFLVNEDGAAAIEYGLIVALIAVALVSTMTTVGERLRGTFETIANAMIYRR